VVIEGELENQSRIHYFDSISLESQEKFEIRFFKRFSLSYS